MCVFFFCTGSPNGSWGRVRFFLFLKYWFAQRVSGVCFKYWFAQRVWRGFGCSFSSTGLLQQVEEGIHFFLDRPTGLEGFRTFF